MLRPSVARGDVLHLSGVCGLCRHNRQAHNIGDAPTQPDRGATQHGRRRTGQYSPTSAAYPRRVSQRAVAEGFAQLLPRSQGGENRATFSP